MDNLQFRSAEISDIDALVSINIDGEEHYRSVNRTMFGEAIAQQRVLVCTSDRSKIIALLYWRQHFLGRSNQWYLEQLTVDPSVRKRGIGSQLLSFFLDYARESSVEKVFGDIHNDNFSSLSMVIKAGGLISGTIEGVGKTEGKDERVIVRFEL